MVQWLRLLTLNAEDPGSIPKQGTRSHMLQLRPGAAKDGEILYHQQKQDLELNCGSAHELLIAKFSLSLNLARRSS